MGFWNAVPRMRAAAIVERKHHVAGARQDLREQIAVPVVDDALHARAAVDIDDGRVALGGIEVQRLEQLVVQRLSVGRREGADLGNGIVRKIGRIRMLRIQSIFQQPGFEGAVRGMQADLRRLACAGEVIDIETRIGRHGNAVHAGFLSDALYLVRIRGVERGAVQVPLGRTLFGGREIHRARLFVDAHDGAFAKVIDDPVTGGELADQMAVDVVQIQMRVAVARRSPNELMGLLQERQLVIQINPGIAGFGEHGARLAGVDVRKEQVQFSLVAALALNRQRLAIGQPIDAGKIDIWIATQIHPGHRAGLDVDDAQFDQHIGAAGGGIALRKRGDIVGGDLEALGHFDRAFIDAREGDVPPVGSPPIAGAAVHLFLGNELRHAVLDRAAAVAGQCLLALGRDVIGVEILIAHIGDRPAGG